MENGASEERGFQVLLDQVRAEVSIMADGLAGLDERIERRFQEMERNLNTNFRDIRMGIKRILDRLEAHERAHTT